MKHHSTHKPKNFYTCVLPPQNDGSYYVYSKKRKQQPYPLQTLSDETVEIIADSLNEIATDSANEIAAEVETGNAEEVLPDLTANLPPEIARDEFQNMQEESVGAEEAGKSIWQSNQRKNRELDPENPRSPRLPAAEEAQTTQSLTPVKRIDIQVLLNGVPVPQMQAAFINEKRETLQSFITDEQGGISASIGLNTLIMIGTSIIIPEKDTGKIVYDLATRQVTQVLHAPPAIEAIEPETEEQKATEAEAGELEVPEQELTEPVILKEEVTDEKASESDPWEQEEPVQILLEPSESTSRNEEKAVVQEEIREEKIEVPQIKPAQKKSENEKFPAKPAINGGNIAGLSPLILLLFATPEVLKLLQNKK